MSRTDRDHLTDALAHIEALHQHLSRASMEDATVADAVSLRLAAAIEAAGRIDEAARRRIFGESWTLAWATRNRIVHGYIFVDRRIIESTVRHDLPGIESAIRLALEELSDRADDSSRGPGGP